MTVHLSFVPQEYRQSGDFMRSLETGCWFVVGEKRDNRQHITPSKAPQAFKSALTQAKNRFGINATIEGLANEKSEIFNFVNGRINAKQMPTWRTGPQREITKRYLGHTLQMPEDSYY